MTCPHCGKATRASRLWHREPERAPAGEPVVPREPTQAMIDAGMFALTDDVPYSVEDELRAQWRAMHDCARSAAAPAGEPETPLYAAPPAAPSEADREWVRHLQSAFADPNDGVALPHEYFARLCDIALAAPAAPDPVREALAGARETLASIAEADDASADALREMARSALRDAS